MLFLETKYVRLLSHRLERFKQVRDNVYHFKCPICGDSQRKKRKARGYIYERGGSLFTFCHNCHYSRSFQNFLKDLDQNLYREFVQERFQSNRLVQEPAPMEEEQPDVIFDGPTGLPTLAALPENHPARAYVRGRQIPEIFLPRLLFAERFFEFASKYSPEKYQNLPEEPRIVIPFGAGFQGRSLNNFGIRYINIAVDKKKPFIFGLDWIDPSQTVYAFEGPFDATFVPNSIATGGGDIIREMGKINLRPVICYDNENRNIHIIKQMRKAIAQGYPVCVWPNSLEQKDVNDMVLAGISPSKIKDFIDQSTFFGAQADFKVLSFSKVGIT